MKTVTVRYTQPKLFDGQKIKTTDHQIKCSDTDKFENDVPVPIDIPEDPMNFRWYQLLSNIHQETQYEIIDIS